MLFLKTTALILPNKYHIICHLYVILYVIFLIKPDKLGINYLDVFSVFEFFKTEMIFRIFENSKYNLECFWIPSCLPDAMLAPYSHISS